MKKGLLFLVLALLLLLGTEWSPGDLSLRGFCRLMEEKWAREVFDLDEKEAAEVFGEDGKAVFL